MNKLLFLFLSISFSLTAQTKHPLTVEDLWAMKRVQNFDVSPDGQKIVFEVQTYSMEANKGNSDIYLVNSDGTNLHAFKNSSKNETGPKFSPDGKRIAYLLSNQIWTANIDGKDEKQLTSLSTRCFGN